jgi:CBS domain-containing protein
MPRTDIHFDAMLRHLGAAYYESLHGRATRADVTRALDTVEEHLHEQAQRPSPGPAGSARHPAGEHAAGHGGDGLRHAHGWSRKVSDVMTTSVITVDRITPYKEIARLLAVHRISGLPVVKMGREVAGVVTEADLLRAQAAIARHLRSGARPAWRPHGRRHPALTAGELMTSPAVTIGPDATVPAAARLMSTHHLRRLPVVDDKDRIIGVVSRRDLLSVFLRPDQDITADIRKLLDEILPAAPGDADVSVRDGVVTLTGTLDPDAAAHADLIPLAIRLMWNVDGVVDVIDHTGPAPADQRHDEAKNLLAQLTGEGDQGQ